MIFTEQARLILNRGGQEQKHTYLPVSVSISPVGFGHPVVVGILYITDTIHFDSNQMPEGLSLPENKQYVGINDLIISPLIIKGYIGVQKLARGRCMALCNSKSNQHKETRENQDDDYCQRAEPYISLLASSKDVSNWPNLQ